MSLTAPAPGAALADWLAYLETLHPKAIDLGLERIRAVAGRLDLSLDCVKITVAGTNGKGSTCAMLESMLLTAGYKVGKYTSPHLLRFNERICVNGAEASDADIVAQLERIEAVRDGVTLTYFEMTTLAALLLFQAARLDAVVLEVGLGGRLDAVNLIDADCAILTSVDLDHMQYLGDTREAIGLEKAHVFRPGRPAICADPVPPQTVVDHAEAIGADLWRVGVDFNYSGDRQQWAYGGRVQRRNALGYPALRGANQLLNASAALAALEALRDRLVVTQQDVRQGLLHVSLPGRMQILPGLPATILDVGHNPHAASALGQNLDSMGHYPHTYAVVGMLRDKEIEATLSRLSRRVDRWLCATLGGPRGTTADELAAIVRRIGGEQAPVDPFIAQTSEIARPSGEHKPGVRAAPRPAVAARDVQVSTFDSPEQAFAEARRLATDNDRILVFGSFATVGPVLDVLRREGRDVLS
ncbi:bifunctional tetrahydrofolate synthase/dihydrofolate synthase [Castellaniella denitrificans]|uniref:Dihydrofolate synthase/folylpolyglutamate synthase n=1 Tax=Castellaniella denitrificans TaxID=56119 RepID=A0ABT4M4W4_9BURK|nr:bifunctional tetrahydrofolate synthase/dihydrofolate synthase [Castellaniella denitrificans]MCZ4330368.1 bifunctional tetrahydrofolate synthase/dihydrofolate synthase [Castellaniella denitrificans]